MAEDGGNRNDSCDINILIDPVGGLSEDFIPMLFESKFFHFN
jgi:hypothetical protein